MCFSTLRALVTAGSQCVCECKIGLPANNSEKEEYDIRSC